MNKLLFLNAWHHNGSAIASTGGEVGLDEQEEMERHGGEHVDVSHGELLATRDERHQGEEALEHLRSHHDQTSGQDAAA